jgi:UDP-GlcNAc3NAcA epimerase
MKSIVFACSVKKDLFKIIPLVKALNNHMVDIRVLVCYAGSEFDYQIRGKYDYEIGLPVVDYQYDVQGGSFDEQIYHLSSLFESTLQKIKPDLVIIPNYYYLALGYCIAGDNCSIPICNLDSGLRNGGEKKSHGNFRAVIDGFTSLFFCTENSAILNIKTEIGIKDNIFLVRNPIYECYLSLQPLIDSIKVDNLIPVENFVLAYLGTSLESFYEQNFEILVKAIIHIGKNYKVILPVHSKEAGVKFEKAIKKYSLNVALHGRTEYPVYLAILQKSSFILTDSTSIQEESFFYNKPCVSLKPAIERESTNGNHVNFAVGYDLNKILQTVNLIEGKSNFFGHIVGHNEAFSASGEIVSLLLNYMKLI